MFPIVAVPETIRRGMAHYRPLFCRAAGFEHVCRYVTGLILSPNKTLQGIHDLHVWEDGTHPSRRAMHEAVFEAAWEAYGQAGQPEPGLPCLAEAVTRMAATEERWWEAEVSRL